MVERKETVKRELTLSELLNQAQKFVTAARLFGATKPALASFDTLKKEIPNHYTQEQWEALPKDTILPYQIAEKYLQFRDYK